MAWSRSCPVLSTSSAVTRSPWRMTDALTRKACPMRCSAFSARERTKLRSAPFSARKVVMSSAEPESIVRFLAFCTCLRLVRPPGLTNMRESEAIAAPSLSEE